jgi:hypothetical protein
MVGQDCDIPRSRVIRTRSFRCPAALRHHIEKLSADEAQFPDFEENVMHAGKGYTRSLAVVTVASIEPRQDEMSVCVHG